MKLSKDPKPLLTHSGRSASSASSQLSVMDPFRALKKEIDLSVDELVL